MLHRRAFLGSAAAAIVSAGTTPQRVKAFCIDFNWYQGKFAPPGHWAHASPEEHVRWYEAAGVNTIQTFCVSCNGFAWYKHGFVPPQPGLKYDFLTDVVRLGHQRGMQVMGYFCVGANSKWGQDHPDLSYGVPGNTYHIPFTDAYLDYLGRSMQDAIRRTGVDGYMIDWVWNPSPKLREKGWIECERKLFTQLTGKAFPASGPSADDVLAYERRAIERCWMRIKAARDKANPNCILWLSCSRLKDPTVINSRLLRECDWVMNEAPSRDLLESARPMVGPKTRLIQNVVGWVNHDARSFLADPGNQSLDLYGFAEPRENSLPLPAEDYLSKPLEAFGGKDRMSVNDRNIGAMVRFFNSTGKN